MYNFPREQTTLKDLEYAKDLLLELNKDYLILYCHKLENIKGKKKYFLNQVFLKYIFQVDIFICNYISDFFPKNASKIYIHHCITDAPLTDKKKELETAERFSNYDFIFLTSKAVVYYFKKILTNLSVKKNIKIYTKLIDTGYPRIDFLIKNVKNFEKNIKDSIIIAPANYLAFTDYTLMHKLKSIIEILLESYDYKIIFRPHPQNRKNIIENNKIKDEVAYLNKFIDNENFEIDLSDNYLQKYLKSKLMISDLSGTAFTYSFITNCPVVFFSPNEKKYAIDYGNFEHFKIREKIGLICNNVENLKEKINFLISNKEEYEKKILNEKNKIENLNVSKKNIQKILLNL